MLCRMLIKALEKQGRGLWNVEKFLYSRISEGLCGHVMNKMNIINKVRRRAKRKFGRRHFQAERRAGTKVLREECAGLVRTARGTMQYERGRGGEMRSKKLGKAVVGSDYRPSWITENFGFLRRAMTMSDLAFNRITFPPV